MNNKKNIIAGLVFTAFMAGWLGLWKWEITMPVTHMSAFEQSMIWAHRGQGDHGFPENTIEGVEASIAQGYPGIELDIYYKPATDQIFVAHDLSRDSNEDALVLDDFDFPPDINIWLDFKNFIILSETDITKFAKKLKNLDLADRAFIESQSLDKLRFASREGLQTILWLNGNQINFLPFLKYYIKWSGISVVSCDLLDLKHVQPHFADRSVFTFTENAPHKIKMILDNPKISVLLTDRNYKTALQAK